MTNEVSKSHMKQLAVIEGLYTQEIGAIGHNLDNFFSTSYGWWDLSIQKRKMPC